MTKTAHGVFVTGTDTGVGKSVVAATLLAAARRRGAEAVYFKPIQTGSRRGDAPDLAFCLKASGWSPPHALQRLLCPLRLPLAASPHLAAAQAGRTLSVSQIRAFARRLADYASWVIAEGAGGLMVPLNERETMLDLAVALGMPLLIVGRAGLGTLNHTVLTWEAARLWGARVSGIVLNLHPRRAPGLIEKDNLRTLARKTRLPVVALPTIRAASAAARPAAFARAGRRLIQELGLSG